MKCETERVLEKEKGNEDNMKFQLSLPFCTSFHSTLSPSHFHYLIQSSFLHILFLSFLSIIKFGSALAWNYYFGRACLVLHPSIHGFLVHSYFRVHFSFLPFPLPWPCMPSLGIALNSMPWPSLPSYLTNIMLPIQRNTPTNALSYLLFKFTHYDPSFVHAPG